MTDYKRSLLLENKTRTRITGMLGFAKRAGKLIIGTELVCRAMPDKKIKLVVISDGASAATKKKLTTKSDFYALPHLVVELDTAELGRIIGKDSAVAAVGVTDDGFAREIINAHQL